MYARRNSSFSKLNVRLISLNYCLTCSTCLYFNIYWTTVPYKPGCQKQTAFWKPFAAWKSTVKSPEFLHEFYGSGLKLCGCLTKPSLKLVQLNVLIKTTTAKYRSHTWTTYHRTAVQFIWLFVQLDSLTHINKQAKFHVYLIIFIK